MTHTALATFIVWGTFILTVGALLSALNVASKHINNQTEDK